MAPSVLASSETVCVSTEGPQDDQADGDGEPTAREILERETPGLLVEAIAALRAILSTGNDASRVSAARFVIGLVTGAESGVSTVDEDEAERSARRLIAEALQVDDSGD